MDVNCLNINDLESQDLESKVIRKELIRRSSLLVNIIFNSVVSVEVSAIIACNSRLIRNRYKITYATLFLKSLRHRYKITCPKLFSKSLKRQAILQTKVQVILKPILSVNFSCAISEHLFNSIGIIVGTSSIIRARRNMREWLLPL